MRASGDIPERVSYATLLEEAHRIVDLRPISLDRFSSMRWCFMRENAASAVTNNTTRLKPESFSFHAFSVASSPAGWPLATSDGEEPYLIIEENTCYVETNLAWLGFWLAIERGVSRVDGGFDSDELLAWQSAMKLFPEVLQAGQTMRPVSKKEWIVEDI